VPHLCSRGEGAGLRHSDFFPAFWLKAVFVGSGQQWSLNFSKPQLRAAALDVCHLLKTPYFKKGKQPGGHSKKQWESFPLAPTCAVSASPR